MNFKELFELNEGKAKTYDEVKKIVEKTIPSNMIREITDSKKP